MMRTLNEREQWALRWALSDRILWCAMAFVAGIMVYISIDELLPLAHRYGKGHVVLVGLIFGMFIMALSLIMLAWA